MTIGLKGGAELAKSSFAGVGAQTLAVFPLIRVLARMSRADAHGVRDPLGLRYRAAKRRVISERGNRRIVLVSDQIPALVHFPETPAKHIDVKLPRSGYIGHN